MLKQRLVLVAALNIGSLLYSADKIGPEGLALPPILTPENKASLIDKNKSLEATKKTLKEITPQLQNGDLVFIRSTSVQSKALEEVTESKWTHVGILFRTQNNRGKRTLLKAADTKGQWEVFEAGPKVRFFPLDQFVGKKEFVIQRFKQPPNESLVPDLFKVATSRLGKDYDVYFLLTHDGAHRDEAEYCSELVWYVYKKGIGTQFGFRVKMADQKLDGPEAQKLIKERLGRKSAPLSVAKWKEQYVIPPESQFVSPLLERID